MPTTPNLTPAFTPVNSLAQIRARAPVITLFPGMSIANRTTLIPAHQSYHAAQTQFPHVQIQPHQVTNVPVLDNISGGSALAVVRRQVRDHDELSRMEKNYLLLRSGMTAAEVSTITGSSPGNVRRDLWAFRDRGRNLSPTGINFAQILERLGVNDGTQVTDPTPPSIGDPGWQI